MGRSGGCGRSKGAREEIKQVMSIVVARGYRAVHTPLMNKATLTKAQIKTLALRIKSLAQFIEAEVNPVACWNMARDLAQTRALLDGARAN